MKYYLKGYYGYKNFGDELLLLGLLPRLFARYTIEVLYIESDDVVRLNEWLMRNRSLLTEEILERSIVVPKKNTKRLQNNTKLFGGGEVFTDARPFPYNGRNYLLGFLPSIIGRKFHVLGGIGTIKKKTTSVLYRFLLGRARSVTVRDETSFAVAKRFSSRVHLYHDFAEDVLQQLVPAVVTLDAGSSVPYHIININQYIRTPSTKKKIQELVEKYPQHDFRYVPGEIGSDDRFMEELYTLIPGLRIYDRTQYTIQETRSFIAGAGQSIAARLHILLCLHKAGVPFVPLVYQEKITKLLGVK